MGSLKRKEAPGGASAKATKSSADARPPKRSKAEKAEKEGKKEKGKKDSEKIGEKTGEKNGEKGTEKALVSRLKEDEPLFPRGGGSVLSPLEQRQIQIQAKKDVLFENESGAPKGEKTLKKKKKSRKSEEVLGKTEDVKIESLNYKRLVKGSLVLGQVCAVNDLDVALALPNNLVGHVAFTAVSDALTERIRAEAADDKMESDDDGDEDGDKNDNASLKSLFHLGQYLRAYVLSTASESAGGRAKRHIELSLQPQHANTGLSAGAVVAGCTVMASVASVEDHGFVMDLGMDSPESGFLPRKQLDPKTPREQLQPGAVVLCAVTGKTAGGKIAQLSTLDKDLDKWPSAAGTVDAFLPGTAADVLVSEVAARGVAGKIIGHLDATADLVHSGAGPDGTDLEARFAVGSRFRARVVCTFPTADKPKLGVSVLPHVLALTAKTASGKEPLSVLPSSALVEECVVRRVEPEIGLYVDVGVAGVAGFVHISRLRDGKVDALFENSGPYKVGSTHKGRVVGYHALDGVFLLSLEQSVLDQPFLRVADVPVGAVVAGVVERLIVREAGITGVVVKIADGVSGLVPELHLADVRLQHPEKKFREGLRVRARVLSTDPDRNRLRLTLKKTLVNSDAPPLQSYDELAVGLRAPATVVRVLQGGAVVQFYGRLGGFLPLSEMSEAYIHDPAEHFRAGQVVSVHVLDFDAARNRLVVSCKDPNAFGLDKQVALKKLEVGDVVDGRVTQKTEDDLWVELTGSNNIKAVLPAGQLTDRSAGREQAAWKKVHVGQALSDLVVLHKNEARRAVTVSRKPSLVEAARAGRLLRAVDDARAGSVVAGFVRNVTPTAAFVQFAGGLCALLPRALMPREMQEKEEFGLHKSQSLTVKVASVDLQAGRFVVAVEGSDKDETEEKKKDKKEKEVEKEIQDDITAGTITKATVVAVKDTQLNVKLAGNVQGRIDVSQVYDNWAEIPDPREPLKSFRPKQIVRVRVLGVHDARNHKFLPISHRSAHSVLELSAKPSDLADDSGDARPLTLDSLAVDSRHLGFVNNVGRNHLWVSLSPHVRGRIAAVEASDDLSQLRDLDASFPVGCALRVRVLAVDPSAGRLDLSARSHDADSSRNVTLDDVEEGTVLAARVTRVAARQIMVQLGDALAGPVHLADMADDFDEADPLRVFAKNDVVRVAVVSVDRPNRRLRLSTRPSRVLSSALPVRDREIARPDDLAVGDLVRGFVRNVSDKGLFVGLGGDVVAMAMIRDLSDRYVKNWKDEFRLGQLVRARVVSLADAGRVRVSLKPSVVDGDAYRPLLTLADLAGPDAPRVVAGRVRRVEDYGAFIDIDGSANVAGLCHRSEMAERPVQDARKLYTAGDRVKARVLKVDVENKKINLGLKPSYFEEDDDDSDDEMGEDVDGMDVDSDSDDSGSGAPLADDSDDSDDDDEVMGGTGALAIMGTDNNELDSDDDAADAGLSGALSTGGFDWTGGALDDEEEGKRKRVEDEGEKTGDKEKKRRSSHLDRTAQLDAAAPQAASDFERRLLGEPDNWQLWIAYVAWQMQASELAAARDVAERALRTVDARDDAARLNLWVAYLNLEVAYGSDDAAAAVLDRACAYSDEQTVRERLASIYIKSGKHEKAESLFETIVKKFGAGAPATWENYADFLHTTAARPERARALLKRATQALDPRHHLPLTVRFAALEFRSPHGDPEQGRTLFEGLLAAYPKRFDLWNQLLDLEASAYRAAKNRSDASPPDPAVVRDVFERGAKVPGLKADKAKRWFRRWAQWEEENGDAKSRERVSAKAQQWAEAKKKSKESET